MRLTWRLLALLLVMLPPTADAGGEEIERNEGDAVFYSISEIEKSHDIAPTLIGGREAKYEFWSANFYALGEFNSCTSTLVASKALLLAAHCVGNGRSVEFEKGGTWFKGTCTHADQFPEDPSADYAICHMNDDVPAKAYERINTDANLLEVGGELLLTGFGCQKRGGSRDFVYRIGEVGIHALPPDAGTNLIVTKGKVATCLGDSGGPAYILKNRKDEQGPRIQVSVNTRSNEVDTSKLSSLTTPMARSFLRKWHQRTGVKICGMHDDAVNCHK